MAAAETPPMRNEASDTPRICLELSAGPLAGAIPAISSTGQLSAITIDDAGLRRLKQLGVNYVLGGGPRIPWQEADLRARMDRLKASGLTLVNLMIAGFPNTLYGRPGRDEEIDKVRESIRAAGRVGLPIVEYNFYAHRITKVITRRLAAPAPVSPRSTTTK